LLKNKLLLTFIQNKTILSYGTFDLYIIRHVLYRRILLWPNNIFIIIILDVG